MNTDHGRFYWIVEVPRAISGDGFISLMADNVDITQNGDLVFRNHSADQSTQYPGFILSRGNWINCQAANFVDGGPVVIDHIAPPVSNHKKSNEEHDKMTATIRYRILSRDGFKCQLCGRSQQDGAVLHVDHIVPIAKGGRTVDSNLRALCSDCNHGKGTKD